MSPNRRQLTGYGLFSVAVALSTVMSLSLLAMVPRNPKSETCTEPSRSIRNAVLSPSKDPKFITTTIPLATGVSPWPRALAADEALGLVYLADGDRGTVTVVAGTALVSVVPVGQEVADVAVDAGAGFVYASVPDPYALYSGHISVIRGGEVITQVNVGGYPGPIAVDYQHNRAYVSVQTASPLSDQVVVLQRDHPVALVSTPPDIVAVDVDPKRGRAYILSRNLAHLSIISGTTNAALVPLDEVGEPRGMAVDPASGLVYVVGQSPFRDAGTALVISSTQHIARLAVGPDPRHVAVDSERGLAYVTNAGDNTVTMIAGTEVISTVNVGHRPDAIAVDSSRDRVYVSNAGDGTTTVISGQEVVATLLAGGGPLIVDTERGIAYLAGNGLAVAQHDTLLGRLPTAAMPACLASSRAGGPVYVCNQGTNTLNVLSGAQVITTLDLTDTPRKVAADPLSGRVYVAQDAALTVVEDATITTTLPMRASDIAIDPVRRLAYVASDGVAVISGTQVLDTIDLGQPPRGVAVNRATGLAYATAGGREDGFVAVISGTERISTVSTGGAPGKLAIDPVRDRVFVLHPAQGRLSVIEGTQRRFPNIYLPRPALDAAVNPLTGDVYIATRGPLVLAQDLNSGVIDLGLEALAVAVDVERGIAYAATRDGHIAVLDGPDVLTTLPAGHRPVDLAIDPETGRVYVANFGSDTVTVIQGQEPVDLYLPLIRRSGSGE